MAKQEKRGLTFTQKRAIIGRNSKLYDTWSLAHLFIGILAGWVMPPLTALAVMILWEPLEIFILSPVLARWNINFGYEAFINSLSDIVFDAIGVALGYYFLASQATSLHIF